MALPHLFNEKFLNPCFQTYEQIPPRGLLWTRMGLFSKQEIHEPYEIYDYQE